MSSMTLVNVTNFSGGFNEKLTNLNGFSGQSRR